MWLLWRRAFSQRHVPRQRRYLQSCQKKSYFAKVCRQQKTVHDIDASVETFTLNNIGCITFSEVCQLCSNRQPPRFSPLSLSTPIIEEYLKKANVKVKVQPTDCIMYAYGGMKKTTRYRPSEDQLKSTTAHFRCANQDQSLRSRMSSRVGT